MKNVIGNIYDYVIDPYYGHEGSGNIQWYYFASLVINLMLIWRFAPEVLIVFMALAIAHFLIVTIYAYCNQIFSLTERSKISIYVYIISHLILIYIAQSASIKWTIITSLITTFAFFIAPESIFFPNSYHKEVIFPICNTTLFVILVLTILLAPTNLLIKLLIIVAMLIIHPIMNYLDAELLSINEISDDIIVDLGLWKYYARFKDIFWR